jgi:hypothetical protein
MGWNKVSAISALGCLVLAAATFAMQIWPMPQIKAEHRQIVVTPPDTGHPVPTVGSSAIGGPKLIAVFLIAGFAFAGISIYGAWRRPKPKLVIHRAVYSAGLPTEVSVTDKLQNAVRDALVIAIDDKLGGLVASDPAFGVRKRLDVEYSYGSDTLFHVSRMEPPAGEIDRLLLPVDSKVQRLTDENKELEVELFKCRQIRDGALAELRTAVAQADAKLPENRPHVLPDEYGKNAQRSFYGLFVRNPGYMALQVHIPSVPVGPSLYMLVFSERLAQLGERDHTRFLEASLRHSQISSELGGGSLHDVMRTANVELVKFAILDKDTDFRPYRTNCVIERTHRARSGLEVRATGQESISDAEWELNA